MEIKKLFKKLLLQDDYGDFKGIISIIVRYGLAIILLPKSIYNLYVGCRESADFVIDYIPARGHCIELLASIAKQKKIVIVLDNNAKSLNFRYSSVYFPGSLNLYVKILSYILKNQRVDVVMQSNSQALPEFKSICEKFKRNYISDECVNASIDRSYFYNLSAGAKSFKTPLIDRDTAIKILNEECSTVVLKAVDTQGSSGVRKINSVSDLIECEKVFLANNTQFIYEKMLDGKQFDVNLLCNLKSGATVFCVSRQFYNSPKFGNDINPHLVIFNQVIDKSLRRKISDAANEIQKILKLNSFVVSLEVIYTQNEIFVIDIGTRVGADFPFLYDYVAHQEYGRLYLECIRNKEITFDDTANSRLTYVRALSKLTSNENFESLKSQMVRIKSEKGFDYFISDQRTISNWEVNFDNTE